MPLGQALPVAGNKAEEVAWPEVPLPMPPLLAEALGLDLAQDLALALRLGLDLVLWVYTMQRQAQAAHRVLMALPQPSRRHQQSLRARQCWHRISVNTQCRATQSTCRQHTGAIVALRPCGSVFVALVAV